MSLPHRIAAGAVVLKDEEILLVRYRFRGGGTYLAAPGGAAMENESVAEAAARETLEETDITVAPRHALAVEDLICSKFKMCKVWMLCEFVSGQPRKTEEAQREGIIEVGWYSRSAVEAETVFPSILKNNEWSSFASANWKAQVLPIQIASF